MMYNLTSPDDDKGLLRRRTAVLEITFMFQLIRYYMFKIINFGSEEIPKFHAVFTITVNGETKDVIPAFTD